MRPEIQQDPCFDNHEEVIELNNPQTGLRGFIAIHSTKPGPAVGGTRIMFYENEKDALQDVLRLSKAMSYKCAIAGLPYGGGKGVVMLSKDQSKTLGLLESYAQEVDKLGGRFYTGEDVGTSEDDVQFMLKHSKYFIGRSGQAGDPSEYAALSALLCMKSALGIATGVKVLLDKIVLIKGLGKTGSELARLVLSEGGKVVACDINAEAASAVQQKNPKIQLVDPDKIYEQPGDVFAPCALSDDLSVDNLKKMKVKVICGTANNQLANQAAAEYIFNQGIAYVPDYLANVGGLINVADELEPGGYDKDRVVSRIQMLGDKCLQILEQSEQTRTPANLVADQIAEQFLKNTIKEKQV